MRPTSTITAIREMEQRQVFIYFSIYQWYSELSVPAVTYSNFKE